MIQIGIATIIYSFGQMRVLVLVEKKNLKIKTNIFFTLKNFFVHLVLGWENKIYILNSDCHRFLSKNLY